MGYGDLVFTVWFWILIDAGNVVTEMELRVQN